MTEAAASAARLAGRICVITGAAGGIGAATVELFRAEGGTVVGFDLAEETPADETVVVDVTDEAGLEAAYRGVFERHGRIDVLMNNAGIVAADDQSVLETPLAAWNRVQSANLTSVFLCCKHGIPHLLASGGGTVINVASFVASMGAAESQISYTASKGGVLALSRELAVEFARRGVRVNALSPGPVETPLLSELFAQSPEETERRRVHLPMGRFARPEELARAALFLAGDDSSYVTGTNFLVDGGITAAYMTPDSRSE
jgi:NAD(P)-dependent dehydrogenase (short-subunit alcohol dehydrogenase family)